MEAVSFVSCCSTLFVVAGMAVISLCSASPFRYEGANDENCVVWAYREVW